MEEQEELAKAVLQIGRRGERNKESLRLGPRSEEALSPPCQAQGQTLGSFAEGWLVLGGHIPGFNGLSPTPEGQDPLPPD